MKQLYKVVTIALCSCAAVAFIGGSNAQLGQPQSRTISKGSAYDNPAASGSAFVDPTLSKFEGGAKCDGVTDDTQAFQAALSFGGTAFARTVFVPASVRGCRISSALTYDAAKLGPIEIVGLGPASRLLVEGDSAGFDIKGSCGRGYEQVYLRDLAIVADRAIPAFAVRLDGVAAFGLDNVSILSQSNGFANGIVLLGTQQGYIHGGLSKGNHVGIYLADCGKGVSSNAVDIGGGRTFVDLDAAIEISGGAADVWIHNTHIAGSTYGVIVDQTKGGGGFGSNVISHSHFEAIGVCAIDIRHGNAIVDGNNDFTRVALCAHAGTNVIASQNLFNGSVNVSPNAQASFSNNVMLTPSKDKVGPNFKLWFGNRGPGVPDKN